MADDLHSLGVFKPVGHVLMALPDQDHADRAAQALAEAGFAPGQVQRYSDTEMARRLDEDLANAHPAAAVGQELNLAKAQRELAGQGCHFVLVAAADDRARGGVAEVARRCGAVRAQAYGRFIIEELVEPPGGQRQVAESPDRGLDAQTRSGLEEVGRREGPSGPPRGG